MKKSLAIVFALGLLYGCGSKRVTIEGEFAACPNTPIILESIEASGAAVADTVVTNASGRFSLKVTLPEDQATFYNLRCAERNVPLILNSGERVVINSVPGLVDGYTIEGSRESELVREVKNIMGLGVVHLDSLVTVYNQTTSKGAQMIVSREYTKEFQRIKREQIEFIVKNAGSLAAIYALNQRIPGDEILFGGEKDIVYYRLVAEEVAKNYPTSPYLVGLRAAIDQYDLQVEFNNKLSEAMAAEPSLFPEIEVPDMFGKKQSLTEIQKDKVLLLDFWSIGDENASFRNAELKELYAKYHDRGFEIYQVSVDVSKPAWVEIVQMQKLPWISVCDFKGANSPAVQLYGVATIPQNYLFDREGNIVAINAYGENLEKELKSLFAK